MTRLYPLFITLCLLFAPPFLHADWINLTGAETSPNIAEIYIEDDHVRLVLEVYVGNLDIFENLVPDSLLKSDARKGRAALHERLAAFASNTFQFVTDEGQKLPAELLLAEPRQRTDRQSPFAGMINPLTRQRVPEAPADKRVLYVELKYPFKNKPDSLTIIPPRDENGMALVTIGFIAYHKTVPIIDFRYLGMPANLQLDWEDPWYSAFENRNLTRHHKSALMSFLYLEPYEVRHEILTRVKDLEQWIDLDLKGNEYIEIDEQQALKQRIGDFLLAKNPLTIDGKPVKPVIDRISFVKVGLKGIQVIEQQQRLDISTAIVGVILAVPVKGLPGEVVVDWELFPEQVDRIPAIATDPAGPMQTYIDPDDTKFVWTNYLKNYTDPTVVGLVVDEELMQRSLPLASVFILLLLVPLYFYYRSSRRQGKDKPRVVFASGFLLIILAVAAYPFMRYPISMPAPLAAPINQQQAQTILNSLLQNVYRAFDFRQEEAVYDKLSLSVSGELLTSIYLQNRQSFAVQQAGGAQARVKQVEVTDLALTPHEEKSMAYVLNARWSASGSVGHWGHIHVRQNLYHALVTIEAVDGNWMITNMDIIDEKRIEPGQPAS